MRHRASPTPSSSTRTALARSARRTSSLPATSSPLDGALTTAWVSGQGLDQPMPLQTPGRDARLILLRPPPSRAFHYSAGREYATNHLICFLAIVSMSCNWTRRRTPDSGGFETLRSTFGILGKGCLWWLDQCAVRAGGCWGECQGRGGRKVSENTCSLLEVVGGPTTSRRANHCHPPMPRAPFPLLQTSISTCQQSTPTTLLLRSTGGAVAGREPTHGTLKLRRKSLLWRQL